MVNNINNFGVINFYENNQQKEKTKQVEDITPVHEEKPATSTGHFPYLTQKCFEEKREQAVEAEIRAACKGSAEALWRTLWDNENLGLVEVKHIEASKLFRDIEKWYGKLPYTERNFRGARNKR